MKELAKDRGIQMEETGFFTRAGGMVPKIGPVGEFVLTLSSLTEKSPSPKDVLRTKDGYFVVRLSAVEAADQSKFLSVKNDLQKRLLYQKQEESFQNWLQQLRAKAKIEINKDVL
jgi:parvulin-like peptidyl-prolyl isomerase